MKTLRDNTKVPDILWYMTLEYKDKILHEKWIPKHGMMKGMHDLTKEEYFEFSKEAFYYFYGAMERINL
jgi:hypothetical protein